MTPISGTPKTRTSFVAMAVLAASLLVTGCAPSATPDPSISATQSPAAISSTTLLDKDAQTILGQAIAYPTALPAQVSSSIVTLPPGVETGLHQHDAPMYAYILQGDLTVTYDGGTVKVYHPGEAIMEAVGTPHNGKNNGTTDVKVLVVNIGAQGVANTVKLP